MSLLHVKPIHFNDLNDFDAFTLHPEIANPATKTNNKWTRNQNTYQTCLSLLRAKLIDFNGFWCFGGSFHSVPWNVNEKQHKSSHVIYASWLTYFLWRILMKTPLLALNYGQQRDLWPYVMATSIFKAQKNCTNRLLKW